MVLPDSVRTVSQGAFFGCKSLRKTVLNGKLEVLGSEEHFNRNTILNGVFQKSALEDVQLPETLKKIGCRAFAGCKNLRGVRLPERLECIGA